MKLTESGISDSIKDAHIMDVSLDSIIDCTYGFMKTKKCRFTMTAMHNNKNTDIITKCINDGKYLQADLFVNKAKPVDGTNVDDTKSKLSILPSYAYNIDSVELEGNMLKIHFSHYLHSKKSAQMVVDILSSTRFYIEAGKGLGGYYYIELFEIYENN